MTTCRSIEHEGSGSKVQNGTLSSRRDMMQPARPLRVNLRLPQRPQVKPGETRQATAVSATISLTIGTTLLP